MTDFDAVIIGSGFGGAVTACRLAEHGYRVLVLERGRRWSPRDYPRRPGDAWLWDDHHPERRNGWIDLRTFPQMMVAQGAGVGGGSLIYANISIEAKEEVFEDGWPDEITFSELQPYYAEAGRMLGVGKIPANQITQRTRLMREAAEAIGHGDRFQQVDLAVTFDPEWHYGLDEPFDARHSKTWTNEHGREQGTCIHLGNCDIGCDVLAKNTLDLNYLARAENLGAEVRPLHQVTHVAAEPGAAGQAGRGEGYRVHYRRIEDGRTEPGSVTGRLVILAAGSLGSTELLLRSRDEYRTLPAVSPTLGRGWCSNGDFLTAAIHEGRDVSPTQGPTISSAIDFLDGSQGGHRFFIEDGGFPDVLGNALDAAMADGNFLHRSLREVLKQRVQGRDPMRTLMPWFAQGRDFQDGVFHLRKRWFGLFGPRRLRLDWDVRRSEGLFDAIAEMHIRLAMATGGDPIASPTWTKARWLVTPHPLGGCNMAPDASRGVTNHLGEVFGYRNLYVTDGSIVPEAIGANPSKTIAALAERIAGEIVEQRR